MWRGRPSPHHTRSDTVWGRLGWLVGVELSKWLRDRHLWRVHRRHGGGRARIRVKLMIVNWRRRSGWCHYGWVFIVVPLTDGCWGRVVADFVPKNSTYGAHRGNVVFITHAISQKFVPYLPCKYPWIPLFVHFDMLDYIRRCHAWFTSTDGPW